MADESQTKTKKKFELKDVLVETVGLVDFGANGEEFFLLKQDQNQEGKTMPEDVVTNEQIAETVIDEIEKSPGLLDRLFSVLKVNEVTPEVAEVEVEVEEIAEEQEPVAKTEVEEAVEEPVDQNAELDPIKVEFAEMKKRESELREQLEQYRKQLDEDRLAREQTAFLQKAHLLPNLPEKPETLATMFYKIAKADSEAAEWLDTFLGSVDALLKEAGFYNEFGTQLTLEEGDPIVKAKEAVEKGEASTLADAYLEKMTSAEAEKYIREHRARTVGR